MLKSCYGIPYSWIKKLSSVVIWWVGSHWAGQGLGSWRSSTRRSWKGHKNNQPHSNTFGTFWDHGDWANNNLQWTFSRFQEHFGNYFDLHHDTFWFWPSLAVAETFPWRRTQAPPQSARKLKKPKQEAGGHAFPTRIHDWSLENHGICALCFSRDPVMFAASCFILTFILFPEWRVLLIVEVCYTFSYLHIFSSHLLIFSSSYLLIFSSSHLLIFSSSHLLIFSSSHLLISSSYLLISHLLLPSCPLAFLPSCTLALLHSCPLALFFLLLFYSSLKAGGSANEVPRNATLSHEIMFDCQKLR